MEEDGTVGPNGPVDAVEPPRPADGRCGSKRREFEETHERTPNTTVTPLLSE